jgi:hypothetical protein
MKTVWIIWADRGEYSDRTEYAVCWFETKEEAEKFASAMQETSEAWLDRWRRTDGRDSLHETWAKACEATGDSQWSPSDKTRYSAVELKRGGS